jgi:hypothetical protein
VQKPESKWRASLVKKFKERVPAGFIWAHDAHFRHGFPDLTMIFPGGRVVHAELKIQRLPNPPLQGLEPRQKITLLQIAKAGGTALVLTHYPKESRTVWTDMALDSSWDHTQREFEDRLFAGFTRPA